MTAQNPFLSSQAPGKSAIHIIITIVIFCAVNLKVDRFGDCLWRPVCITAAPGFDARKATGIWINYRKWNIAFFHGIFSTKLKNICLTKLPPSSPEIRNAKIDEEGSPRHHQAKPRNFLKTAESQALCAEFDTTS